MGSLCPKVQSPLIQQCKQSQIQFIKQITGEANIWPIRWAHLSSVGRHCLGEGAQLLHTARVGQNRPLKDLQGLPGLSAADRHRDHSHPSHHPTATERPASPLPAHRASGAGGSWGTWEGCPGRDKTEAPAPSASHLHQEAEAAERCSSRLSSVQLLPLKVLLCPAEHIGKLCQTNPAWYPPPPDLGKQCQPFTF